MGSANNLSFRVMNNICYSFRDNGECRFGENCRFEHVEGRGQSDGGYKRKDFGGSRGVCFNYRDNGTCDRDDCKFAHVDNDEGYSSGKDNYTPRRGICFQFRDNGDCQYGSNCRFNHDLGGGDYNRDDRKICRDFRKEIVAMETDVASVMSK